VRHVAIIPVRISIDKLPRGLLKELKSIAACKVGSEEVTPISDLVVFLCVGFERFRGEKMNPDVALVKNPVVFEARKASTVVRDDRERDKC